MSRLRWLVLCSAALLVSAFYLAKGVEATSASGFAGATLAKGRFGEIDVNNLSTPADFMADGAKRKLWMSMQRTKGESDLYVQSNVWQPGGTTGWHTHPGHSLIIVTAGTVTAYDGHDPECKPTVYTPGMGFVDAGGDHVHNLRNEGSVEARTVAVQLVAADATRRIDAENPGNCAF